VRTTKKRGLAGKKARPCLNIENTIIIWAAGTIQISAKEGKQPSSSVSRATPRRKKKGGGEAAGISTLRGVALKEALENERNSRPASGKEITARKKKEPRHSPRRGERGQIITARRQDAAAKRGGVL